MSTNASQRDTLAALLNEARSIRPGIKVLAALVVGGGLLLALAAAVLIALFSQRIYIAKPPLINQVTQAVKNNADVAALQHLLNTAPKTSKGLKQWLSDDAFYNAETSLQRVLMDARSTQLLSTAPDVKALGRIETLLSEHRAVHPFAGLASTQRQHFSTVRDKLGGTYPAIQPEMDRLADSMQHQNELVSRYLKDSTISFWVSITGLVFSLLVGIGQLLQGQQQRINRVLAETSATMLNQLQNRKPSESENPNAPKS